MDSVKSMYPVIKDEIAKAETKYIRIWKEVCEIESPTDSKDGVDRVGRYFADRAEELGFSVEVCPQEVAGDVICIVMNPEAKGPSVAFSAHMDTVHPIGLFGPSPVRIEGDRICGPGVTDCKGGAVASLMAMEALQQAGVRDLKVMLLLQSDEEVGSAKSNKATIRYICDRAKDCIAFFNCEGQLTDTDVVLYRKGILRYRFDIDGTAAHAAKCAVAGKSAILEAAMKIIELEKVKEPDGTTICCGTIAGGSAQNTVPAHCSFTVDIRYADEAGMRSVVALVERVAQTSYIGGTTCRLTRTGDRVAMEKRAENFALLERMNAIYSSCGMPTLGAIRGIGGSDAAYTTQAGIPTVDSIAVRGDFIHTKDEFAYLSSLSSAATRLAVAAYGLTH